MHEQLTFATYITLTLQAVAAVEFREVLGHAGLSGAMLVELAEQV